MRDLKVGDKVIVRGEYDGLTFKDNLGVIITAKSSSLYGIEFEEKQEGLHSCFPKGKNGYCYYVGFDCVKKVPSVKYIVKKGLTVQQILDAKPCASMCEKMLRELYAHDYLVNSITQVMFNKSPVMQDNIGWLEKKGFITKSFTPFKLTFNINSLDELKHLWHMTNVSVSELDRRSADYRFVLATDAKTKVIDKLWKTVDLKVTEVIPGYK